MFTLILARPSSILLNYHDMIHHIMKDIHNQVLVFRITQYESMQIHMINIIYSVNRL
jgi:hypothetical protein